MGTHQQQESRTMGKVKSGKPVHLISVHRGDALHSNMEEGGGCSWGGEDHWELGWRIHAEHKRIKNGGNVTLQGLGSESYMHSNAEGESSDSKWLKWGDVVYMKSMHDKGYWASNSEEGAGFSWGDANPNVAWRVVKCEEPSDSSDSDCDED